MISLGRIRLTYFRDKPHTVTSTEFVHHCPYIIICSHGDEVADAVKVSYRRKGSRSLLQPAQLVPISVKASSTVCI